MTSPARFLFEHDFAAPVVVEPEEPQIPMIEVEEHEKLLAAAIEAAREEGYQSGFEAGKGDVEAKAAQAQASQAKRTAEEAKRLALAAQSALAAFDADHVRVEKLALELAYQSAKRLAENLIGQRPEVEILALVEACLSPLREAPHLVMRLNPAICETLEPQLKKMAHEKGFEGRLMILAEPEVLPGDCRVEWADGGISRNRAEMEAEIESHIRTYAEANLGVALDLEPAAPDQSSVPDADSAVGIDDTKMASEQGIGPRDAKTTPVASSDAADDTSSTTPDASATPAPSVTPAPADPSAPPEAAADATADTPAASAPSETAQHAPTTDQVTDQELPSQSPDLAQDDDPAKTAE